MRYSIDLHIHSALSPCAENDMTPNNIINMARIKGLDIISVTDHNSTRNCEAVAKCGLYKDILVVPGIELETSEEVHLLCLFANMNQAHQLQKIVDQALYPLENREDIFGKQLIINEYDEITGSEKRLLLSAVQINLHDAIQLVRKIGGVAIPAHINRNANSIISNLGFIPQELDLTFLELPVSCQVGEFIEKNAELKKYSFIQSSDAHYLGDILERIRFLELETLSTDCLIDTLRKPSSLL